MSTAGTTSTHTTRQPQHPLDGEALDRVVARVLRRWPSAGVAVGVVRDGDLAGFHGHGVADTRARRHIDEGTVFRVGSLTKTFTGIAVMQLWEQGLVDLDAPVTEYLRAFPLDAARPWFGPVTLRHLLTHTAGIGYWPRPTDLLRPGLGAGVQAARRPPGSLAEQLHRGLRIEVEPGTRWMYSNHGFGALGQVVEDVTGEPLDRYLRAHLFDPLGMRHTDLVRSGRVADRLATGYVLRRHGLEAVPWRDVPMPGGGAACSSMSDLGRYVAALLTDGGGVLRPETLATMFRPHFRPDPRLPGMGLAFELSTEGGHRVVGKDGVVAGFLADVVLAPDEHLGVVALSNTGGLDARGATTPVALGVLRRLLGLPDGSCRTDLPPRADVWGELCGWYGLPPGPMTNLFIRLLLGAGAEVRVRDRRLVLQPLSPLPTMRRGMPLHADDPEDPFMFRVDLSEVGRAPMPVVFAGRASTPAQRLCFGPTVLLRRPDSRNPRLLAVRALGAGAAAMAARAAVRRTSGPERPTREDRR